MIDHTPFESIKETLTAYDERREELIKQSRQLNGLAKKAMYQTHRDDLEDALKTFKEADLLAQGLKKAYAQDHKLKFGAVTAALQEWGECYAYYVYAKEGRLVQQDELGLEDDDYLLALADMTGELTRRAVLASINKEKEKVKAIRAFVDDLLGIFLGFNFRNGELRKKTDSIRWNLQKIEELLVRQ